MKVEQWLHTENQIFYICICATESSVRTFYIHSGFSSVRSFSSWSSWSWIYALFYKFTTFKNTEILLFYHPIFAMSQHRFPLTDMHKITSSMMLIHCILYNKQEADWYYLCHTWPMGSYGFEWCNGLDVGEGAQNCPSPFARAVIATLNFTQWGPSQPKEVQVERLPALVQDFPAWPRAVRRGCYLTVINEVQRESYCKHSPPFLFRLGSSDQAVGADIPPN